jgi:hypothetical protein
MEHFSPKSILYDDSPSLNAFLQVVPSFWLLCLIIVFFFVLSLSHMNSMPCNYFCYCLDVWWKTIHGCMRMGSQHVLPVVSMWCGFAFYWIKCQTFFFSLSGVFMCCFGEGYRSIPLRYGLCGYLNDLLAPVKKI